MKARWNPPPHVLPLVVTLIAALTTFSNPANASTVRGFHIGETTSAIAPLQDAPYSIEWELARSTAGGGYQVQDQGRFCYGKAAPCFDWVGQTLTGPSDPSTGGQQPVWEYGIHFTPPGSGGSTNVVFTNIAGLKDPENNRIVPLVPNFLQAQTASRLDNWSESFFQLSSDVRLRVRARLVRSRASDRR